MLKESGMSDNAELHGKILGFLMAEWSHKENRQLVGVDLMYSPGQGFKDEEIRRWERADEPEFFAEFVNIEKLVTLIIEIAEGEADAKAPGKHRFIVRARQHLGSKPSLSFALYPSYRGSGDDMALQAGGGGGGGGGGGRDQQVIASHAGQLMRINAQMFEGTIRVLGQQNANLHDQVATLTAENAILRKELEEARSNKMDREFQLAMAAQKNERTNAAFQKALQLGTVITAKIGAGTGGGEQQQLGETPLGMLLMEFYKSIRPEQMNALMQMLDMAQKIMFMEIVNMVNPPSQGGGPGQPPNSPNGGP